MATVAALFGIEESRTLWAVWGTTQLHIGGYRSVRSRAWLVTFRSSSSDNPLTSLMNHPCLCLIAPISQHIMLPQSTVATALIFNWELKTLPLYMLCSETMVQNSPFRKQTSRHNTSYYAEVPRPPYWSRPMGNLTASPNFPLQS